MNGNDLRPMADFYTAEYVAKARKHFPKVTKGLDLEVGWKATRPDGSTYGNYFWPLVRHGAIKPVLHEATDWSARNDSSCPRRPGDGLCLITSPDGVGHATSGTVRRLAESTIHVLVYAPELVKSDTAGKGRAPWVIDVDCCVFTDLVKLGLVADLSGADLSRADLYGANLYGANLYGANLSRANLSGANLSRADLYGADLSGANLYGADLYGANLSRANLSRANLSGARGDRWTRWPSGFVIPAHLQFEKVA